MIIDERMKYRIVGLIVIMTFFLIFLPLLVKKNTLKDETSENSSLASSDTVISEDSKASKKPAVIVFKAPETAEVSLDEPSSSESQPLAGTTDILAQKMSAQEAREEPKEVIQNSSAVDEADNEKKSKEAEILPKLKKAETKVVKPSQPASVSAKHKPAAVLPSRKTVPAKAKKVSQPAVSKKTLPVKTSTNVPMQTYCIQVGAFSNAKNAQALVSSLRAKGYPAEITRAGLSKVRVCKKQAYAQALALRGQLEKLLQTKAMMQTIGSA